MEVQGRLWITREGKSLAGRGRIELLVRIDSTGSISQAAKAMGMSYKAAWDAIDAMNMTAGKSLVERVTGGKGGGGSHITAAGYELIAAYERYEKQHQLFLQQLAADEAVQPYLGVMERLHLATSARNQLFGTVQEIRAGNINDEIVLALNGGQLLRATITHQSAERLQLKTGSEVYALIKASWISLRAMTDPVNTQTENVFPGVIQRLVHGGEKSEVTVALSGDVLLTAVITHSAQGDLQWIEQQPVAVVVGITDILLGVI